MICSRNSAASASKLWDDGDLSHKAVIFEMGSNIRCVVRSAEGKKRGTHLVFLIGTEKLCVSKGKCTSLHETASSENNHRGRDLRWLFFIGPPQTATFTFFSRMSREAI